MSLENPSNKLEAKDFKKYVSNFTHEAALNGNVYDDRPVILLPEEFFDGLLKFVDFDKEITGAFLVKTKNLISLNVFEINSIITLGIGNEGDVEPEDKKIKAINKLLRNHPELSSIVFHTHPKTLDSHYYSNFSDLGESNKGDAESLTKAFNRNNNYMHVLVTPTHFLTFGKNLPQFKVAKFPEAQSEDERSQIEINRKLKQNIIFSKYEELQNEFRANLDLEE